MRPRRPSRYAYVELPDERASTVVGFLERAVAEFGQLGVTARRLTTENAWCYTRSCGFVALPAGHEIRRPTTDQPRSQRP
jgi:hypothetical protein